MSISTNLRQKVLKGIVWSATQNWGRMAILFVALLILSRLLEPEAFGLVALATVFRSLAKVLVDQGFGSAIVQRNEIEREHLDTSFWTSVVTGGLLTLLVMAGSGPLSRFFGDLRLAPIISWISLSFLIGALSSTHQAVLQRRLAFKSLATGFIIGDAIGSVTAIVMALSGFGVWSLVAQHLVSDLAAVPVLWRVCDWQPELHVSKKHFQELFIFGRSIVGTRLLNFFKRRSDDILIGYFLGPAALGYYTIAYQLLLVITRLLLNVINAVALPAFSRLQNNPAEMRQAFYTATYYASLIAFPAFLGISVMAPELVLAFYGPKWAPSIPVAQMLGLAGILQALFFFNGHIIVAAGKPAWYLTLMIVQSVASLFVFAVAVHWGIVAVAAAFVIRGYLTAPLALWMLKKLIRIELTTFLREHLAPLAGALIMVVAVVSVKQLLGDLLNLYALVAVGIGSGMVVYVATILLIKPQLARQALDLIYLVTPKLKWSYSLGSRE